MCGCYRRRDSFFSFKPTKKNRRRNCLARFRGGGRIQVNLDWVIIAAVRTFSDFQNGKQICHSLPSEKLELRFRQ